MGLCVRDHRPSNGHDVSAAPESSRVAGEGPCVQPRTASALRANCAAWGLASVQLYLAQLHSGAQVAWVFT